MSFVLRRLAPAVLIVSLLAGAGHVSALLDARKASNLGAVNNNADTLFLGNWVAPVPGTRAYVGHQERGKIDIGRRDCLPNGTNYCFGDTVNFCFNCGTCCVDGIYCCGAGGLCCGTGCCASGQTCDDGQCKSSVNAVTVTSIAYETVTRTATQVATILLVIVETSTIVASSDITVSNEATQTNVVWSTTTIFEAEATPGSVRLRAVDDTPPEPLSAWKRALSAAWTSLTSKDLEVGARSPDAVDGAHIVRRQATKEPASVEAASTVTQFTTQTVEITSVVSVTITTSSTSFVMKTVVITNTRVFNAQATTETTSTLTIISRQPKTEFITTTATPILPGTATRSGPTASSTDPSAPIAPVTSSKSVSTGAIVGAAVGGTVFAIIIAAIVIFMIRHRHNKKQPFDNDIVLPPDALDMNNGGGMDMRQPTYPAVLPHFATAPAHHAAQFQPPNNLSPNANTYLDPSSAGAAGHQRTSSGYTTLVGTPNLGGKKDDRLSAMTMASGTTSATTPPFATPLEAVEAPTEPPTRWFEVDGSNQINEADGHGLVDPVVGAGHSPPPGTGSPPLQQQQTPPQHLRQNSNSSSTYSAYGGHDVQSISGAYFQGSVGQAVEMGPGPGEVQQQYGQQYQQLVPEQQAYHEQVQQQQQQQQPQPQGYTQQYYHMQPNLDQGGR